jgi:hypothetical protein
VCVCVCVCMRTVQVPGTQTSKDDNARAAYLVYVIKVRFSVRGVAQGQVSNSARV